MILLIKFVSTNGFFKVCSFEEDKILSPKELLQSLYALLVLLRVGLF